MNSTEFKDTCKTLCNKIIDLEKTECVVCLEEIKVGTLLIPCNHYQYCFNCGSELENCSICRNKINHVVNYGDNKYMRNLETFINALGGLPHERLK